MKVSELCVCDVAAATKDTNLARAGALMRKYRVGSLPVIDRQERVIGMVTDRDCFLEVSRRNAPASEVYADEVMTDRPACCGPQDDVLDCLAIMRKNRVHRLPVVDEDDRLVGIISIDDVICHAADQGDRGIPYEEVIETLCAITEPYQAEAGYPGAHRELGPNGGRERGSREEKPELERRPRNPRKR